MNNQFSLSGLGHLEVPSLEQSLGPMVAEKRLAGGVLAVTDRHGIIWQDQIGYADVAAARPMDASNWFWIASMTKAFTSLALMLLWDEGKVGLDDPVSRHLPEFGDIWVVAHEEEGRKVLERPHGPVTVRQIQNHTSGLPFKVEPEAPHLDRLPLDVAVKIYAAQPLLSHPGAVYRYSNCGTNVAGRIVEVLSGQRFEDFLQVRILDPLGMEQTTFWPAGQALRQLARNYRAVEGQLVEEPIASLGLPLDDLSRHGFPAGGLFSTVKDVGVFCRLLLNDGVHQGKRLISSAAIGEMTRITNGDLEPGYGLGLAVERDGSGKYGHGGALGTAMKFDPRRGLAAVWMVQHADYYEGLDQSVTPVISAITDAIGERDGSGSGPGVPA